MGNLKFYNVFNFGGTIAILESSLSEILKANFLAMLVVIGIISVISTILPTILLVILLFFLLITTKITPPMIVTIVVSTLTSIYFMFDYHYGWMGWRLVYMFWGESTVEKLASWNMGIIIINICFLFILGSNLELAYKKIYSAVLVFVFLVIIYPISKAYINDITTQAFDPECLECKIESHNEFHSDECKCINELNATKQKHYGEYQYYLDHKFDNE